MQDFLKRLSIISLISLSLPILSHANDISIYPTSPAIQPADATASTEADIDVWARIRKGFSIPNLENPQVIQQTEWYSSRPDYIQRTTLRASHYLFHVVEELEKRHMPTELALLPFIESAFNPQAYSTAKAAGMWQFIPSTGRDFNLKQNLFTDERRDVLASTDAALTYLQKLYDMFGDWQLALAAYNWGEGSVQRAINRNLAAGLPIDFNSLSIRMPSETRNYVPKLQAIKNIIASPSTFGIDLPKVDNQPYFVTIGKTRNIDVNIAAQLAELSLDEFKALNPQFNRPVIIGSEDTKILLPESNADKFKANLAKWTHALSNWTAHTVRGARERIETIAKRFGTTPEVIRTANRIPPRMAIAPGSTVLVPASPDMLTSNITPELAENARLSILPDRPNTRLVYVRTGRHDTLASIARQHHVSVDSIRQWNNLRGNTFIAGQKLQLHVPYATRSVQMARSARVVRVATKSARKTTRTANTLRSNKKMAATSNKKRTITLASERFNLK